MTEYLSPHSQKQNEDVSIRIVSIYIWHKLDYGKLAKYKPDLYLPQELHSLESHKLCEGYSLPVRMFHKFEALWYGYILDESKSYIKKLFLQQAHLFR